MLRNYPPIIHAFGITCLLFCCCNPVFSQSRFNHVQHFCGSWIGEDGRTMEHWNLEEDGILFGSGTKIQGNDTILIERLTVYFDDGKRMYSAQVLNQNQGKAVLFRESGKTSRRRITFSNPEHDFPNHITYKFKAKEKMVVKVSGDSREFKVRYNKMQTK